MTIGMPTIVSNFPYYKEQLKKYEFGIAVDPDDEEAISNAIRIITENVEIRQHLAQERNRAVELGYDWKFDADKLIEFYKEI